MKIASITRPDADWSYPAIVDGDSFHIAPNSGPRTVGELLETYHMDGPEEARESLSTDGNGPLRVSRTDATLHAPISPDARLFCMGGAYTSHLRERDRSLFVVPHQWLVPDSSIVGPGDAIELPRSVSEDVMPAVELAVVLGKGGSYIDEAAAVDHIAGFTITNDVTARTDWPGPRGYKIMDTFSPCGPHIVTADEIDDPLDLEMEIRQDGETICTGSTAGHRFTLSFIVSYLSTIFELRAGDIISTGDPGGVGDRLRPGSTLESEVENVGVLENDVTLVDSSDGRS